MKIGMVFHKNPLVPKTSIDVIRLAALSHGMRARGAEVTILAPVAREALLDDTIPVKPVQSLAADSDYDLLKTCYHYSIELTEAFNGPIVSRIVRVVDEHLPERDEPFRLRLLECQKKIEQQASALALNNVQNAERWRARYGPILPIVLTPTGCPETLPPVKGSPYTTELPVMLFLGSIAAPRMVPLLNMVAERLRGMCELHIVGLDKVHMYGGTGTARLHPTIVCHGEVIEDDVWDYIRHASIGLALATGLHEFDNDVSKVVSYLRGGLPTLSEEPIVNNELIRHTGLGATFKHGSTDDMVEKVRILLSDPHLELRSAAMEYMAAEHSWRTRVDTYIALFESLIGG